MMMNGEIPSVPITTLAGVASLTDMLPELPLPSPLLQNMHKKSLLYNPLIADDAQNRLHSRDPALAQQLVAAIRQTSTDHIELKDGFSNTSMGDDMPQLLKTILTCDPQVFNGNRPGSSQYNSRHANFTPQQPNYPSAEAMGFNGNHHQMGHQANQPSSRHQNQNNSSYQPYNSPYQSQSTGHLPQEINSHTQNQINRNISVVNGFPDAALINSQQQNDNTEQQKAAVASPAQATSAERLSSQQNIRQPSSSVPSSFSDDLVRSNRSCRSNSHQTREEPEASSAKKQKSEPVVVLQLLDPKTIQQIKSAGSVKTDASRKRKRITEGIRYNMNTSRKKYAEDSDSDESWNDDEEEQQQTSKKRKTEKKHKRTVQAHLSLEELMESPTFKKFNSCVDYIFDSVEEVNFTAIDPNDDQAECPPESLIAKGILTDLCGEAAKLRSMGAMNQMPPERLVKLLTILQWNIRDGSSVTPNVSQDDADEDEQKLWRQLTMERIMRSMDATLTALFIMTSPNMPKQVYLEDVIERILFFGKFQLHNTIYPEFDPVYKTDANSKDGYHGSIKLKRARAGSVKHKSTIALFNKISEMVGCLGELIEIQELTDTVILQASSLGVSPFFVENVSELQLNAIKLVTTIFSRYDQHRQLILEDIFASLARLPSSKRNIRIYRLNSEESIQMVTALALQLIQCVIKLPQLESDGTPKEPSEERPKKKGGAQTDNEVLVISSYETAMRTGYNFLSVFLKKCTTKNEEDYRPLFENFVQDLLSTVNKPEWPASELLLSLLGGILVKQFSNKSTDMSLRVASLEYLGIVAARLRKDAVSSRMNPDIIQEIVEKVNGNDDEDDDNDEEKNKTGERTSDVTQNLQEAMLTYLAFNGEKEPSLMFARQFYIAQWFRDTNVKAEKNMKSSAQDPDSDQSEGDRVTEQMQDIEKRKEFLFAQAGITMAPSYKPTPSKLDYESACLVARYLSSKRPFAQSFDIYLTQILKVLCETAVAVRTKAMKCLTAVIEADPSILARDDMQRGVHGRFLDQSTSVREAAVELVGKFILIRPELIPQYYEMLSERILDTGISVRKRVIRIFKDICIEESEFPKIPEMCVKMIQRVNDEEGIKKLINEVFQTMWFSPISTREKDSGKLLLKVMNITDVVAASKEIGYDFFEQMLENLLKKDEDGNYNKSALTACRQIVDCLVDNVLKLEEGTAETSASKSTKTRLCACLSTLFLFSKIKPDLMVNHATTLQPYLDIKCSTQEDYLVLHYVARILELVVPLMNHPSESFLAQLEEDMMKLVLKHGMMVLQSCVSCLGAVVNMVSYNFALVKDCFQKFFSVLSKLMTDHREDPDNPTLKSRRPTMLRSLFTVGLLCKHFDFDAKEMGETKVCVREKVFDVLTYFMCHEDEDVRLKALNALGFFLIRHYDYMLGPTVKDMYNMFLTDNNAPTKLRCQVLRNLQSYLVEEENRMLLADQQWKKQSKNEDLKEMGDIQSGMASAIMQVYLKQVLESFFHENSSVRLTALGVIKLILKQGLVHPVQCVPYLICMGTDTEAAVRIKADQQMLEIEKKYPGFTHMKAQQGLKFSYKLQQVLTNNKDGPIRGMRIVKDDIPTGLNSHVYKVIRGNRQHRRGFLTTILNLFDDSARISLAEQLYTADNLAYYPYQFQDEPLFIIHQIDIIVSVTGSNLLQSFKEALLPKPGAETRYDDDDDDREALMARFPENIQPLEEILDLSRGCVLLLVLKQHLKDMYGFTDSKIHRYSPSEQAKVHEKPLSKKNNLKFNPHYTIECLTQKKMDLDAEEAKTKLVEDYLEFKDLMMSIDPSDEDDSGDEGSGRGTPPHSSSGSKLLATDEGKEGNAVVVEGEETGASSSDQVVTTTPPKEHHPPPLTLSISKSRTPHSERKKSRLITSSTKSHHHRSSKDSISKTPTSKKKKKKRKKYCSDDESDDDDDPDFTM
ncbi:nipped-B-like protein [Patella vulgata]|uniref:nipped-B-like protein n=1 Tax=Patella vulgata TaxID=6465 RepID=UPI0021800902|nr:nipped-B-like protein [Patella vulgata]